MEAVHTGDKGNQVRQKEAGKGKVMEMILKKMRSKQQGKKLMVWPLNILIYKFHSMLKRNLRSWLSCESCFLMRMSHFMIT